MQNKMIHCQCSEHIICVLLFQVFVIWLFNHHNDLLCLVLLCPSQNSSNNHRYPAVFWKTNKAIAFLFSIQLVGNGLQNLMAFSAMSIMYKVHQ